MPEPPAEAKTESRDPHSIYTTSLSLSIFSANVDVQLEQKLVKALHRSTLKDPPTKLKYELIYVKSWSLLIQHRLLPQFI
jgi:hypothetical protein